jgi:hypothetical protein
MAAFQYRVNDATGLIAGVRDLPTAEWIARNISLKNSTFVSIHKTTHGKGAEGRTLIASWLHGKRIE